VMGVGQLIGHYSCPLAQTGNGKHAQDLRVRGMTYKDCAQSSCSTYEQWPNTSEKLLGAAGKS
jgi:hypothetical protein